MANLQLASLLITDGIPELIGGNLEIDIPGVSGCNVVHHYMIDNGSQGNTITQAVVNELSLQTEPYGARGNALSGPPYNGATVRCMTYNKYNV